MKCFLTFFLLFAILIPAIYAQSDTIVISFKSGAVDKILIPEIQSVKFENITSVEDVYYSIAKATNYPNPFSDETAIEFVIENSGTVEIHIYDNLGIMIRRLVCENCAAGVNHMIWDTKDERSESVNSGIYYYEIRYARKVFSKKMILIK